MDFACSKCGERAVRLLPEKNNGVVEFVCVACGAATQQTEASSDEDEQQALARLIARRR